LALIELRKYVHIFGRLTGGANKEDAADKMKLINFVSQRM